MKKIIAKAIPMVLTSAMLVSPVSIYAAGTGDTLAEEILIADLLNEETGTEEIYIKETGTSNDTGSIYDDNEQADPIDTTESVDPEKLARAIKHLALALARAGASSDSIKSITDLLKRVGNGASFAGATIAILNMLGILENKGSNPIKDIKSILLSQNLKLQNISDQLNDIAKRLVEVEAKGEVYNRSQTALKYVDFWNRYRDQYLNGMELSVSAYQGWTVGAIEDWAYAENHENLYAYYTMVTPTEGTELEKAQTYSRKKNMNLEMSECGETIEKEYTIGLPGEYITDCLTEYRQEQKWDPDTYRTDITELLKKAVKNAAAEDELGCSQAFKDTWNAADDAQKDTIAGEVAGDLFNSAAYICSCKGVNNNQSTVNQYITFMGQTWNNTTDRYGGVAGQIVPMQMTACFEGETKDNINNVYTGLSSILSFDSFFTMTIAAQSDIVDSGTKQSVTDQWLESMDYFSDTSKVIKGYDNFCYVTNSLVTLKECTTSGTSSLTTRSKVPSFGFAKLRNVSRDSQTWKLYDSSGKLVTEENKLKSLNEVSARVLYLTWNQNKSSSETSTFTEYLNKYKTGVAKDYTDSIMIGGYRANQFPKTDGITMLCIDPVPWNIPEPDQPNHFIKNKLYKIMLDPSKAEYTPLHDSVTVSLFNPTDGQVSLNNTVTARAQYWRGSKMWRVDEPWYFAWAGSKTTCTKTDLGDLTTKYEYTTSQTMPYLECSDVPKSSEETVIEEGKFDADAIIKEMAIRNVEDGSIDECTDEDILSFEQWKSLDIDYLMTVDSDDELKEYIDELIEDCIVQADGKGLDVSYSDSEVESLTNEIFEMYRNTEEEIENNDNMDNESYLDPFGIYGNDEVMEKLAESVLPESEFTTDAETVESVENMITATFNEPCIYLTLEKVGDSYQIKPSVVYDIEPKLLVWYDEHEEYDSYEISDDVMKELGLSMRIRFSTADADNNEVAYITHYDDYDTMNVLETKTAEIQGSGSNGYTEISVTGCSPFAVTYSKTGSDSKKTNSAKTGDNNNMTIYFIIMGVAATTITAVGINVVSKRRRNN